MSSVASSPCERLSTVSSAAPPSNIVSLTIVRGVCTADAPERSDWNQFKYPRQIGLDEVLLPKRHSDFVVIVSAWDDQGKPVVVIVLEDRKKETIVAFLISLFRRIWLDLSVYEAFANSGHCER